jgi:glutaminase
MELRPSAPIPEFVSDRQFFQAMANAGHITTFEALAAVQSGAVPASIQTVIDGISDEQQRFAADMYISGSVKIDRNHAVTKLIAAEMSISDSQLDALFRSARSL